MKIDLITLENVKFIIGWKYEKPYECYNYPDIDILISEKWAIIDERKRKDQFRSLILNDELIGYFRIQRLGEKAILGIGLHPNFCGKGLGSNILKEIIEYIKKENKFLKIELQVRKFNIRALKCYIKSGFNIIKENDEFLYMEKLL